MFRIFKAMDRHHPKDGMPNDLMSLVLMWAIIAFTVCAVPIVMLIMLWRPLLIFTLVLLGIWKTFNLIGIL